MDAGGALDKLFRPASVAIIGASADPTRIGGRAVAYMLSRGYAGGIYPVNPGKKRIQGLRAYDCVADLPAIADVAIVALPADRVVAAVEQLGKAGVSAAIVFSAGFAETGSSGAQIQRLLAETARRYGTRLLGPNSLGLFNARIGYYPTFSTSFETGWPLPGRISIASQSGAYGTHIFAAARRRGIGIPFCVMTGNEADLTVGEVIGWLANDPHTDVIAAYVEGIRSAESFVNGLEAARLARKPVVILKAGRSEIGEHAARSHTAAIAGAAAVTDAVLAEFGVVRARNTDELLDIVHLATRKIYPVANTLGVLTISGGAGILIADEAQEVGLAMPPLPAQTQARLRELVPFAGVRNPVDCTAQVLNDLSLIGHFAQAVFEGGAYASVLAFFSQSAGADSIAPRLRSELKKVVERYPDRLFVLCILAPQDTVYEYAAAGMVVFEDPVRATVAIRAMGKIGEAFAREAVVRPQPLRGLPLPHGPANEAQAMELLGKAGIDFVPAQACSTPEAAVAAARRLGYPVVMKVLSPHILHKSDVGGVALGVASDAAARTTFNELLDRTRSSAPAARLDGILVARQIDGGIECIMGIQQDPVFGPMAMFGIGGIFVEILRDTVLRRCPFDVGVAESMIRSVRAAPLMLGARGRPPVDVGALAAMLSRLSVYAAGAGSGLRSIDLNPVFALPDGQGAFAADVVIATQDCR